MKNISLQMTPAAALKATANKSESNNDKSVTSEPSAFNTMLSNQLQTQSQSRQLQDRQSQDRKSVDKLTQDRQLQGRQLQDRQIQDRQIQDKQVNDKQVQNKQVADKQLQGSPDMARQDASKAKLAPTATGSEPAGKAGVKADKAQLTDARKALADNTPPAAAALTAAEVKAELTVADAATLETALPADNSAETNAASLVAAFNVAVVNPQLQALSAEAAGSRQVQMDKVLNQALTQSKAGAAADKDAALESKGGLQKANWLDTALPTAMRQAAAAELAQTKQQAPSAQAGAGQTATQQTGTQQTGIQQNNSAQNLAQQTAAIAATMPPALPAVAAGPALAVAQAGSSNFMNTSPGKSGWDQAISQKVLWMAGEGGVQSATLTLNPPDLGPLQVVIHVNNDQVEARFMSDNADVRQALQDGLENLRDRMHEAGIQLGQTNVSAGGQSQQEFAQTAQGQRAQRMSGADVNSATETVAITPAAVRSANGLVDTFA